MNSRSDIDPALRALARWAFLDTETGDWIEVRSGVVREADDGRGYIALAAAEAAPLDVDRLADVLRRTYRSAYPGDNYDWRSDAEYVAREYAALRSSDTETAGEAG